MDFNFSFEGDEEWDLELIQGLVRKEEEAIAAKKATQQQLLTIPSSYGAACSPDLPSTSYFNNNIHSTSLDAYIYDFSQPLGFNDSPAVPSSNPNNSQYFGTSLNVGFQNKRGVQQNTRRIEDRGVNVSSSQANNKNDSSLQRELDRLNEQLLFQEQEKLELYRDRDENQEKLRRTLEELAAKEAEIEHLKQTSLQNLQNVEHMRKGSGHQRNGPDLAHNTVNVGVKFRHENKTGTDVNSWSPPLTSKESNKIETQCLPAASKMFSSGSGKRVSEHPNGGSSHNISSFMAEELKAHASVDNASNSHRDYDPGQAQELLCRDTTAQPKSARTKRTSSGLDQNAMQFSIRDIQLINLSYKLQSIWDPAENGRRETNLVSKLFGLCETDLYTLLQNIQGSNSHDNRVGSLMVCDDLTKGNHVSGGAKDIETEKFHTLSSKMQFILSKLANAVAPTESLIEVLLEFCTLQNVEIVESAFRVLNSTLRHGCDFRRETIERGCFQGCTSKSISGYPNSLHTGRIKGESQSQFVNKLVNDNKFSIDDCIFPHKFSSRVFLCQKDVTKRDWKAAKHAGSDKDTTLVNGENFEEQIFGKSHEGYYPCIVNWVMHFKKISQIALDSASTGIKLQAVSMLNLIVMKSHPDSEREQFGLVLFYRNLSELLRKEVGTDVQLQSVQLLFHLLNCPKLFKLFCGCKKDIEMHVGNNSIILDVSCIKGTHDMVLQGLAECFSQTGHDMQVYTLRRHALHVLAFIAASGEMGVACLLNFVHSGCNNRQEQKFCSALVKSDGLCMDGNTGNHSSDFSMNKSSNDLGHQKPNIPMLLVSMLDFELDEEEKDAVKIGSVAEGVDKERATLVREGLILLHSLICNPSYGASVLQELTNSKVSLRLSLTMVKRISSRSFINSRSKRGEKASNELSDTIELANELQHRILFHARDVQ